MWHVLIQLQSEFGSRRCIEAQGCVNGASLNRDAAIGVVIHFALGKVGERVPTAVGDGWKYPLLFDTSLHCYICISTGRQNRMKCMKCDDCSCSYCT